MLKDQHTTAHTNTVPQKENVPQQNAPAMKPAVVAQKPAPVPKPTVVDQKPAPLQQSVLQNNKNTTNVASQPQLVKSETQNRLIEQVKSEVYDDLTRQAMFELEQNTSVFKL